MFASSKRESRIRWNSSFLSAAGLVRRRQPLYQTVEEFLAVVEFFHAYLFVEAMRANGLVPKPSHVI